MKIQIKNEEVKKVNWDTIQIVTCQEDDTIVLTTGVHELTTFEGIALPSDENPVGEFSRWWSKSAFVAFNGTITLTN